MRMRFDILTLFPDMFTSPFQASIIKRAQQADKIHIAVHDIRAHASDRHRTCDDTPYGGGAGMVMKIEPLARAITAAQAAVSTPAHVVYLSPDGEVLNQRLVLALSQRPRLLLICGHYEGIDERVRTTFVQQEISIGDYVLTGGELAAMVVVDAVSRYVDGVINHDSVAEESHSDGLLEYPHYTRPAVWQDQAVPAVLASGNHGAIAQWRRQQRLLRTLQRRPDLLASVTLDATDRRFLAQHGYEIPVGTPPK
jgi:tRNA (guanine37-N1)-methyltransferase